MILAHSEPRQVLRLCRALGPHDHILIHVDLKTPWEAFGSLDWPENVEFLSRRVRVHWGHFSMVEATLLLLARALSGAGRYGEIQSGKRRADAATTNPTVPGIFAS
jgi:hypothetical protein